jgi:DNA-directed RNA polymerase subunit beta'
MVVPPTKDKIIAQTQKDVEKIHVAHSRGIITEGERYLKVIDAWTHARERIGEDMLHELRNDTRDGRPLRQPDLLHGDVEGARLGRADPPARRACAV